MQDAAAGAILSGLSAVIALQLVLSFGLGWWLRGFHAATLTDKERRGHDAALWGIVGRLEEIVSKHSAALRRITDKLLDIAAEDQGKSETPIHHVAAELSRASIELSTGVKSIGRMVVGRSKPADSEDIAAQPSEVAVAEPTQRQAEPNARMTSPAPPDDSVEIEIGDRRAGGRTPFKLVQHVAAYSACLSEAKFQPVHCNDVSATGFSYWADKRPTFQQLLVRFGMAEKPIVMVAEVVHATLKPNGDRKQFLIGCRFRDHASKTAEAQENSAVQCGA